MIEHLDIANVRSFAGDHSIELAPITLIFGPNSAGKSTLIKVLGLLKQTLALAAAGRSSERSPLLLEGSIVDLGSFTNVVHRHETDRELTFGIQFTHPDHKERSVYAGLGFMTESQARAHASPTDGADSPLPLEGQGDRAFQTVALLGEGQTDDGGRRGARPRVDRVRFERDALGDRFRLDRPGLEQLGQLILSSERSFRGDNRALDASAARTMHKTLMERERALEFIANGFFPALPDPGSLDHPQTDKRFGGWFAESVYEDGALALDVLLERLAYLGPMRAAPARFEALSRSGERASEVGPTGEHVTRLLAEPDGKVLAEVNRWLGATGLDIGYALDVQRVEVASGTEIGDLYATALIDRGGVRVTPLDVGFGISQVLPVVVQIVANRDSTICIEQPEIHIHPRLQTRLGDLLLESVSQERGNQVIIETHSEHVVNRLKRRIRNRGKTGQYEWLTPDDIAVIYVNTNEDGSATPRRLRLDEDGDFIDEWPGGFFEEGYEEAYA